MRDSVIGPTVSHQSISLWPYAISEQQVWKTRWNNKTVAYPERQIAWESQLEMVAMMQNNINFRQVLEGDSRLWKAASPNHENGLARSLHSPQLGWCSFRCLPRFELGWTHQTGPLPEQMGNIMMKLVARVAEFRRRHSSTGSTFADRTSVPAWYPRRHPIPTPYRLPKMSTLTS